MKKQLLFPVFLFFTIALSAQKDSVGCSTIILENDMELPAFITKVESEFLFYKKCPDSTNQQYSLPLHYIDHVRAPNGKMLSPIDYGANFTIIDPSENTIQAEQWVFRKKIE